MEWDFPFNNNNNNLFFFSVYMYRIVLITVLTVVFTVVAMPFNIFAEKETVKLRDLVSVYQW